MFPPQVYQSYGETVEQAIDRAFGRVAKDGKDLVVYLGDRIAAVVFSEGGQPNVIRLIDEPKDVADNHAR